MPSLRALLCGYSFLAITLAGIIPPTNGTNNIIISHLGLEDTSRPSNPYNDSSKPESLNDTRKLMISLFYPVPNSNPDECATYCSQPYMPPQTAKYADHMFFGDENAGVFDDIHFNTCCKTNATMNPSQVQGVVVIEPQVGATRHMYAVLAYQIAAIGYAVLTIDRPYDSGFVEWSDEEGRNETFTQELDLDPFAPVKDWNGTVSQALQVRMADLQFVLDALPDLSATLLKGINETGRFNTTSVGIVGHGLGGTLATWLALSDPRFVGNVNMLGTSPLLTDDIHRDVYFFGRSGYQRTDAPNLNASWPHIKGAKAEYDLKQGGQFDFSDLPLIYEMVAGGADGHGSKENVRGLGSVDGMRAWQAVFMYARGYMEIGFLGYGNGGDRLQEGVREFEDILVPYGLHPV